LRRVPQRNRTRRSNAAIVNPRPQVGLPDPQGLYDPLNEHDACGMGFVASIRGEKSHSIIEKGLEVLVNLTHRGACGCDPETGDGAGILIQIPHKFFARECDQLGFNLPEPGRYAAGMVFLPVEMHPRLQCEGIRGGFWNSVAIVVPSVALSVIVGAVNGYCLAEISESKDPVRVLKYFRSLWLAYQNLL